MLIKFDTATCILATARAGDAVFEVVRERVAKIDSDGPRRGHDVLRHARVECHTDELVDGATCASCDHLLNAVPSGDGTVRVRCMFLESDPVTTLMVRAAELATIEEDAPLAVARALMLACRVAQLAVVSRDGLVVGLITATAAELVPDAGAELVASHLAPLPVVPRTTSLASAARALKEHGLDCLAVVDGDDFLGLLTRDELSRLGVPL